MSVLTIPKEKLNTEFWVYENGIPRLKKNVREVLLSNLPVVDEPYVEGVYLIGGSASYQWEEKSDVDVNVNVNVESYYKTHKLTCELNEALNNLQKYLNTLSFSIGEHEVHYHAYSSSQNEITDAIYDVENNLWVLEPLQFTKGFDPSQIYQEYIKHGITWANWFNTHIKHLQMWLEKYSSSPERHILLHVGDEVATLIKGIERVIKKRRSFYDKLRAEEQGKQVHRPSRFSVEEIVYKYLEKEGYLNPLSELRKYFKDEERRPFSQFEEKDIPVVKDILDINQSTVTAGVKITKDGAFYQIIKDGKIEFEITKGGTGWNLYEKDKFPKGLLDSFKNLEEAKDFALKQLTKAQLADTLGVHVHKDGSLECMYRDSDGKMKLEKDLSTADIGSVETPRKIHNYIMGYSTLVPIHDREVIRYKKALDKFLPNSVTVYRAFRNFGGLHDIFAKNFAMSFTESKQTAINIAKEKCEDGLEDGETAYVIEVAAPKDRIYFHHKYDKELGQVHPKEKEVMVHAYGLPYDVVKEFYFDDEENLVAASFVPDVKNNLNGEPVDVFKNPTNKEFKEIYHEEGTGTRAFLDGNDIYVWENSLHRNIQDQLKLSDKRIPLDVATDGRKIYSVRVTDHSRKTAWHHSPEVKELIENHPFIRARKTETFKVNYYDEYIDGPWDKQKAAASSLPAGWISPEGTFKKVTDMIRHDDALRTWPCFKKYWPKRDLEYNRGLVNLEKVASNAGADGWISVGSGNQEVFILDKKIASNKNHPAVNKMRQMVEKYIVNPTFEVGLMAAMKTRTNTQPSDVQILNVDTELFIKHGVLRKALAKVLVDVEEIKNYLESSDAQFPMSTDADKYEWAFDKVSLSKINLSPSPSIKYRADDPDILSKVRKSFEGPEDSIKHARSLMKTFEGKEISPVILAGGPDVYGVYDGYHRILAAALRGDKEINAYIAVNYKTGAAEKSDYLVREDSPTEYTITKWAGGYRPEAEYKVKKWQGKWTCNCISFGVRKSCKHTDIVQKWIKEGKPEGKMIEAKFSRATIKS